MIGVLALGLTQAAAYAARGSKARDPISMVEAIKLAEAASSDDFAVVMNEDVLARLNLIVTDPGRAKFHRESLVRMAEFKEFISGEIERYKHPKQLLAVPLIESGYRNLPEKEHQLPRMTIQSAGLWQFIRQTARNYGLRVGGKVYDRQDVKLSTDAAMRYLARNHDEFKHWYLSLAAYNQGEGFVRNAIAKGGTRDAFKLIEQGHLGDYLVHLMAAAIVVAHPELVD
jgi:membrane-bound lytic murein transglycosylase D